MKYESFYPRQEDSDFEMGNNKQKFHRYTQAILNGSIPRAPEFVKMLQLYKSWLFTDSTTILNSNDMYEEYRDYFKQNAQQYTFCNFILSLDCENPVSRDIHYFASKYKPLQERFFSFCNTIKNYELVLFFQHLEKFPFSKKLNRILKRRKRKLQTPDEKKAFILNLLLTHPSFKFIHYPIALFPFHKDPEHTPLQEQISWFANYRKWFKESEVHFIIPDTIYTKFEDLFSRTRVSEKNMEIQSSIKYSTFSTEDGLKHKSQREKTCGSLLDILQRVNKDIIHISYIDDIEKNCYQKQRTEQRQILQGKLMLLLQEQQDHIQYLSASDSTKGHLKKIYKWYKTNFVEFIPSIESYPLIEQKNILLDHINQPLRVCGVTALDDTKEFLPHLVEKENGNYIIEYIDKKELNKFYSSSQDVSEKKEYICLLDICCSVKKLKNQHKTELLPKSNSENHCFDCLENSNFWMDSLKWNTCLIKFPETVFCSLKGLNDLLEKNHQ